MATNAKLNTYASGDVNLTNIMQVLDKTRVGIIPLTITHMSDNVVPAITAGSFIEVGGSLFYLSAEEAISITDPTTGTTVANGVIYVIAIPSGDDITFAFTATAPAWSDTKQGWYGTGSHTGCRYTHRLYKTVSGYNSKHAIKNCNHSKLQVDYEHVIAVASLGSQTVGNATEKLLASPSEVIDTHNAFSPTATFTAPVRGIYRCNAQIKVNAGSGNFFFKKNGTYNTPSVDIRVSGNLCFDLALEYGDTVELYVTTSEVTAIVNNIAYKLIAPL